MGVTVTGDNDTTAGDEDGATCGAASDESSNEAIGIGDTERDSGSGTSDGDGEREVTTR